MPGVSSSPCHAEGRQPAKHNPRGPACAGTTAHDWGRWQTSLPATGQYRLEVYIPYYNANTTNAQYIVYTAALPP